MPERVRTDNKIEPRSITFFIHRVIHSARPDDGAANHGMACFQGRIAAEIPLRRSGLWKTITFEWIILRNEWRLKVRIESGNRLPARRGIFARSSAAARAAAWEVSAIHTRRSPIVTRGARSRACG